MFKTVQGMNNETKEGKEPTRENYRTHPNNAFLKYQNYGRVISRDKAKCETYLDKSS